MAMDKVLLLQDEKKERGNKENEKRESLNPFVSISIIKSDTAQPAKAWFLDSSS